MVICSYLLIAEYGKTAPLVDRLSALPGCEVARAENRDVLLVVTEAACAEDANALRDRVAGMDGVRALVLTFGEIAPEAVRDPAPEDHRRTLPVLGPSPVP
jgi:nitrate reductase NapAB chaperone NapD